MPWIKVNSEPPKPTTFEDLGYVQVVRCKECKNADYGTDEDGNRFMKCIGSVKCYGGTTPDFFCADGERKEGR